VLASAFLQYTQSCQFTASKLDEADGVKKLSHIYVLLTETGTLFSQLIKQFTDAPYNHASLALDLELNDLFSFGRKHAKNPWVAGFIQEDIYEGTFRHFPGTRCVLLQVRVTQQQRAQMMRIIQSFSQEKNSYRYNLVGLLGVMMNVAIEPKNAYFCSQFVAQTLKNSGIPLWKQPPALVTPNDFLHHPAFDIIYEGYLYDYPLLDQKRLAYQRKVLDVSIPWRGQAV
jgi:hypothetical protein